MSVAQTPSIYETTFAKTDRTDAILVVEGKKLHVNKTLLSIHSDYFNTLFNSNFKEKSMSEIEIKDVKFEDFATLLSLVHPKPIDPSAEYDKAENLLKLAEKFSLPYAKNYMDLFFGITRMHYFDKLELANKYNLPTLTVNALRYFTTRGQIFSYSHALKNYSDRTKARVYERLAELPN
ncbi:hypothetical protein B9Z55_026879 [Caenorhabditis nigoni]|uniref:BTB domain-containing protein n=1 Tax=Caenorhabditis nigoni TaxID=1611254 RepID=A0A2G5SHV8_9PELO|nr:hypothetical protein B9Z55_026879 [Caenorhabditis nigoni]